MKPGLNLKLFAKFFWGIASDEEKTNVYDSEESHDMLKEQWNKPVANSLTPEEKDRMLSRIKNTKASKVRVLYKRLWRVAAIVILLIAIGGVYQIFFSPFGSAEINYIQKSNPAGQRSQIVLPDNSTVWLNAQSTITYPESFEDFKTRKIKLSGEAFFKVSHKKSQPFIVKTNDIRVKVLGTSFNIKAYQQDDKYMTTLVDGSVELKGKTDNTHLKPGEMGIYDKNKESFEIKKDIDTRKITSWKEGKLILEDIAFSELAEELERWYGAEIELTKEVKGKHSYTMTITDENLQEVCNLIKESTPIDYKIKNNKVVFFSTN